MNAQCMHEGRLLTPDQVAQRLQMSRLTILHWLRAGKLPSVRLGKLYRIRQGDLEATLQAHQSPTQALDCALGQEVTSYSNATK